MFKNGIMREDTYGQRDKLVVSNWTTTDISEWLRYHNFDTYVDLFYQHKIDGETLLTLTKEDLQDSLKITILGDVKKMLHRISELQSGLPEEEYEKWYRFRTKEGGILKTSTTTIGWNKGAFSKLMVSLLYLMFSIFCTSLTMTIVHDRVPDPTVYPPLPDIFLDNIQPIYWAFEVTEVIIVTMALIFVLILATHKHRMVVLRRFSAILGTIFLLRCVTMFVTSLSVPGVHLKCDRRIGSDLHDKLQHAWKIFSGLALSISGVRTCGDYMFSGHTIMLTVLNHCITEYTPSGWRTLHIFSWLCNFFGMFLILAAHEHYSIDVFVAFYISSRLFLYYHSLANAIALYGADQERLRSYFPLFSFFERYSYGILPNTYEIPFTSVYRWLKYFFVARYNHNSYNSYKRK